MCSTVPTADICLLYLVIIVVCTFQFANVTILVNLIFNTLVEIFDKLLVCNDSLKDQICLQQHG